MRDTSPPGCLNASFFVAQCLHALKYCILVHDRSGGAVRLKLMLNKLRVSFDRRLAGWRSLPSHRWVMHQNVPNVWFAYVCVDLRLTKGALPWLASLHGEKPRALPWRNRLLKNRLSTNDIWNNCLWTSRDHENHRNPKFGWWKPKQKNRD